jgi:beta-mannosidase
MPEASRRTLTLLAPLAAGAPELDGEWRVAFPDPGQANDDACAAPHFPDAHWEKARLPHLVYGTAERSTLWYRHHFQLDPWPPREHTLLRFGGAFYKTDVWLNGIALGAHQGYFQPFGFDVSGLLRPGENVVAVRCHFPIEANALKRKTAVAGIFADWDCKPYPSAYYPHLPAPHEWIVPLGLWQPVQLQSTGSVLVESFNVLPEVVNPQWWAARADAANVRVVVQVRNLAPDAQEVHLGLALSPGNFEGETVTRDHWKVNLAGYACQQVTLSLTMARPRLWFPWTHGTPNLYRASLSVTARESASYELTQVFGNRTLEAQVDAERWEWQLNGRRIFPKGSNYVSDFYLDRVNRAGLSRDLVLAREANLDLLRVHAHIAPPDLYRLCDEQGLLVMCDFPLIWTYASSLSTAEQAAFRAEVQRQVEDMLGLLGSHPSIALWSMHNEPPWTPDGSFLGADVDTAATNREIDEAMAEHVRALDSTRPVQAASGQYDQHLYQGWYAGHWRDNRDLQPTFPTEFGVQALPNRDSPFWETVNTQWTVTILAGLTPAIRPSFGIAPAWACPRSMPRSPITSGKARPIKPSISVTPSTSGGERNSRPSAATSTFSSRIAGRRSPGPLSITFGNPKPVITPWPKFRARHTSALIWLAAMVLKARFTWSALGELGSRPVSTWSMMIIACSDALNCAGGSNPGMLGGSAHGCGGGWRPV